MTARPECLAAANGVRNAFLSYCDREEISADSYRGFTALGDSADRYDDKRRALGAFQCQRV